jgi:hypothetical protein
MRSAPASSGPLPIVQYWHSATVPADVAGLIETFADRNPQRPHLLFDREAAEAFLAEHFSALEVEAFRTCAVPAMQADYFRYGAAHVLGGVCVDVDCRCIAPLGPLLEGGSQLFRSWNEGGVMNGLLVFDRRRHPLPKLALELATANIIERRTKHIWTTTGPLLLNALLRYHHDGSFEETLAQIPEGQARTIYEDFRATIGSYDRVTAAFEGVRICRYEEGRPWILNPERSPSYKATAAANWVKQSEIFTGHDRRSS